MNKLIKATTIYKALYEYLTYQKDIKNLDKILAEWEPTPLDAPIGGNIGDLVNICAVMRREAMEQNDKDAGRGDIRKAMKVVMDNAMKIVKFNGVYMINGQQYVCDGHQAIRPYHPIEVDITPAPRTPQLDRVFSEAHLGSKQTLELPTMAELKAIINVGQAEHKAKYGRKANEHAIPYRFKNSNLAVNAKYLKNMLTAFPDAEATCKESNPHGGILFQGDEGEALLLPIKYNPES